MYHSAIGMLLLTDKLNLKCYVLYETKELLTITKMFIPIILIFIISIVAVTIIIIIITNITIIIIITIAVITISIIIVLVKSA